MGNRLAHETSPYLRQHADNPVDWQPWDEAALQQARDAGRPILLSVGYSACHWCHVMAHECFEDADTAALMNRHFVNIKVDREERPDLDQIYQAAHQLIAHRAGGWPLTMFLTPQGKPFWGGTYFPKRPRYNLPGFDLVLERVAQAWREQRAALEGDADKLVAHMTQALSGPQGSGDAPALDGAAPLAADGLRASLMRVFDAQHGGFGGAPKFPQPPVLAALLHIAVATGDGAALNAVLHTLRRMAAGGLYDQLAGGFFRYSTDAQWLIPHFEKMLYDNGPLLRLYAQAWQITHEPLFETVCAQTAAWLMREMQGPEGGYFSSIDADSQGEEGAFYLWTPAQVRELLDDAEFAVFAGRHGLDGPPNFEQRAWHLHVARPLEEVCEPLGRSCEEGQALLDRARPRLLARRDARVRPHRDEKVLTSWNALAIDGMAFAARVFDQPAWAASAGRALAFLRDKLWRDGRLLATHKDGRSHLNAYLDDHAFLLGALLERLQGEVLDPEDLGFAIALADGLLAHYEDAQAGGFFFTSHDHEALVLRPVSAQDGAMPSGNGTAALQLQRLGHLLGETRYLAAAERTLQRFAADVEQAPAAFATLVVAMGEHVSPPTVVLLGGPEGALAAWRRPLDLRFLPGVLALRLPANDAGLPAALLRPGSGQVQAWVCRGPQCLAPITEREGMLEVLGAGPDAGAMLGTSATAPDEPR